ncbi:hypothetical protein FKM82_019864 [Ascaphus truei]
MSCLSWRVDHTLSSSLLERVNEPLVHLHLSVTDTGRSKPVTVTVSATKLRVLLTELKQALEMMNALN